MGKIRNRKYNTSGVSQPLSYMKYFIVGTVEAVGKTQSGKYQWFFISTLGDVWTVFARDVLDFFEGYNGDVLEYLDNSNRSVPVALPHPCNCNYPPEP